jgi:alanine racemase
MHEAAPTRLPATRLEIDLDAIRSNLRTIRRMAGGRRVIGVIKADAYGHGASPIAPTLVNEGVDYLAAGSIDDAVNVRGAGVAAPILVLGSLAPDAAAEVVRHRLIASIDDTPAADALESAASAPQPVWIKVDCGFGRYGVALPEAEAFIHAIAERPRLKLEGIYTHLPFSDAAGRAWAVRQTAAFRDLLAALERAAIRFPVVQATASPGLLCGFGDDAAVATGHLLYGLNPLRPDGGAHVDVSAFRPALRRIVTRLVHRTHRLHGDAAANYLRQSAAPLGIVPIGLTHGYRPAVGDAFMIVRGAIAPVLRVTLEATILDLAEVPNSEVGEPVTVLGHDGDREISPPTLADWQSSGVLPMIMGLGRALPRVYAGQHE